MAYDPTKPPQLINMGSMDGFIGPRLYTYTNTDANGTVEGANYLSDAQTYGMKKGDILFYIKSDTPTLAMFIVISVDTATKGITLGGTPATAS